MLQYTRNLICNRDAGINESRKVRERWYELIVCLQWNIISVECGIRRLKRKESWYNVDKCSFKCPIRLLRDLVKGFESNEYVEGTGNEETRERLSKQFPALK